MHASVPYLAGGGAAAPLVIVGKSALFASRCPFSDAKSSSAGCPSEPWTAPPPAILGYVRAYACMHVCMYLFLYLYIIYVKFD